MTTQKGNSARTRIARQPAKCCKKQSLVLYIRNPTLIQTSYDKSKVRFYEGTAPSHSHQRPEDDIGYLIGIEGLISLVQLHQARQQHLDSPSTGTCQAHDQGDTSNCSMDLLACVCKEGRKGREGGISVSVCPSMSIYRWLGGSVRSTKCPTSIG